MSGGSSPALSPQMKVMVLLEKAQELVRFASPNDCNALFLQVAKFTSHTLENQKKCRDQASRVSLDDLLRSSAPVALEKSDAEAVAALQSLCSCVPIGTCALFATQGDLCGCCGDGDEAADHKKPAEDSCVLDGVHVDSCAKCVCLLQRGNDGLFDL